MGQSQSQQIIPDTLPPDFFKSQTQANAAPNAAPDSLPADFKFDQVQPINQFSVAGTAGQTVKKLATAAISPNFLQSGVGASHPDWNEYQWGVANNLHHFNSPIEPPASSTGIKGFLSRILPSRRTDYTPKTPQEQAEYSQVISSFNEDPSFAQKVGKEITNIVPALDSQRLQSNPNDAISSSLANLIMLRQGVKAAKGNLPEFGSPNAYAESVQPLSGYKIAQPQLKIAPKGLPAAPLELGSVPQTESTPSVPAYSNTSRASRLGLLLGSGDQAIPLGASSLDILPQEGVLPAARKFYDNGRVQYLTRPLRAGESPDVARNTNTNVQEYFINKMRQGMEQPTGTGSDAAAAVESRMAEYAKTPWERTVSKAAGESNAVPVDDLQGGHAGGAVSSIEELSRTGTNYVVSKSGQLTYHGKTFAPESTPNGSTHVTALPDGTLRVNAGQKLNLAQEMSLRQALPKPQAPTQMLTGADFIRGLQQMAAKKAAQGK